MEIVQSNLPFGPGDDVTSEKLKKLKSNWTLKPVFTSGA